MILQRITDTNELLKVIVNQWIRLVNHHLQSHFYFNIAISGGQSPQEFYKLLSEVGTSFQHWSQINVFWVDERWVDPDDPESNYGAALRSGLELLPLNFFPFNTKTKIVEDSLEEYRNDLRALEVDKKGFDLTILGAGTDGHTASIFMQDLNRVFPDLCFATHHPQTGQMRLSLTPPFIARSKNVWLILTGETKREILQSIDQIDVKTPIQQIVKVSKEVTIFTDIKS